jgi:hypothetical protein
VIDRICNNLFSQKKKSRENPALKIKEEVKKIKVKIK